MKIWVDADACPVVIKDILFRAAQRTGTLLTLVANQAIRVPSSEFVRTVQVPSGFDVAAEAAVIGILKVVLIVKHGIVDWARFM